MKGKKGTIRAREDERARSLGSDSAVGPYQGQYYEQIARMRRIKKFLRIKKGLAVASQFQ
jgi:hypothetical protein